MPTFLTFEAVFDGMARFLEASGARIKNTRTGAKLTAILQAATAAVSLGHVSLVELQDLFFVSSSKGTALRRRVTDLQMPLNEGTFTEGSVLAVPNTGVTGTVGAGTLLQDAYGGVYEVQTSAVLVEPYVVLDVKSIAVGAKHDRVAGAVLTDVNGQFLTTTFIVGDDIEAGVASGDLGGGGDADDDDSIKARFPTYLKSLRGSTIAAITTALLGTDGVSNLAILNAKDEEGLKLPGYMTIFVAGADGEVPASLVAAVDATMRAVAAAGMAWDVVAIQKVYVPVAVTVYTKREDLSKTAVVALVQAAVLRVTAELIVGKSIYLSELIAAASVPGVVSHLTLTAPTTDRVVTGATILSINTVDVVVKYED